ncbi:E3 SUMO-protein ligase ZBED1-like [Ornithodoros turicata]|uniref:E3 SUMO-protein ligase ZBED1-like n=1 Tax=Ornithodoros turicata TaxID=34597 RepID=UPI0031396749
MWTSCTTDSYLTVTCHFLQETVMWSVLSTAVFHGSHTAENVAQAIGDVADDWGIRYTIVALVTDNEKRMVLAARLLGIDHLPCFAHTLNLTVQDGLKSSDELNTVLLKCKNVVRHIRSSSVATAKLREEQERIGKVPQLKLIKESPTRWNSIFYMLKRILEVGEALTLTLSKLPRAPSPLSAEDVMLIEDVVAILEPFEDATKLMSGDQYTTISLVIPVGRGIVTEIEEHIEPTLKTTVAKIVLQELVSSLHRRMDSYEKRDLTSFATMLDPRMKERAFLNRANSDRTREGLVDELSARISESSVSAVASPAVGIETSQEDKSTQKVRILRFLDEEGHTPLTPTSSAELMLRQNLEIKPQPRNSNPLEFWRSSYSSATPLCEVAFKYLCVPATSVPAERVFSTAGQIISDRRSSLKGKKVDMLIFIHQNYWLTHD